MNLKRAVRILCILLAMFVMPSIGGAGHAAEAHLDEGTTPLGALSAGQLDTSFGGFSTDGVTAAHAEAIARQPDGKIVIIWAEGGESHIARFHPNGSLDDSFQQFTSSFPFTRDLAVQTDGKIVAVGWDDLGSGHDDFVTMRLLPDGQLDTSFGAGGYVFTDFGGGDDRAFAVAFEYSAGDQKILVAGSATIGDDRDFAVARYLPDGQLDPSFSSGGKKTIGFGHGDDEAKAISTADGGIVVAGIAFCCSDGGDSDFGLARLDFDGSLDAGFGTGGRVIQGVSGSDDVHDMAIQQDGMILVAGRDGNHDGVLIRFTQGGSIDSGFGQNSITRLDPVTEAATGVAQLWDGKIVVVVDGAEGSNAVRRLNPDGSLDASFGDQWTRPWVRDLIVQPDGKLLVAVVDRATSRGYLARYNPDGTLDTAGKVIDDFQRGNAQAHGIVAMPGGRIVVAYDWMDPYTGHRQVWLLAYREDGTQDYAFQNKGRQMLACSDCYVRDLALTPSGQIVAAGFVGSTDVDFVVWRVDADGTWDEAFFTTLFFFGKLVDFGHGHDYGQAVLVQPGDEKIIIAGFARNAAGNNSIALARFEPSGQLDLTFGSGGKVSTNIGTGYVKARAAALQADGKIVVAGGHDGDFVVLRYLSDGSLDNTFGSGGIVTIPDPSNAEARAVAVLPDGRIVVAGVAGRAVELQYGNDDFALAFLEPDGSICSTCGQFLGGLLRTDFGTEETPWAIALQHDGKILLAGGASQEDTTPSHFYLACYQYRVWPPAQRGYALDESFGQGGKATVSVGKRHNVAQAITLDPQGRILAAGYTHSGSDHDVALVRLLNDIGPPPDFFKVYLPFVRR